MKAEQIRFILGGIIHGNTQRVDLTKGDTPRSLRNYFLVIAKNEGYQVQTSQHEDHILVTVFGKGPPKSEQDKIGNNGFYRKKNSKDFNWPARTLVGLAQDLDAAFRINLTPKPRVGSGSPETNAGGRRPAKYEH